MDHSVKKAAPGVSFGRRGPTATSRAPNRDGGSTHSCNRLGCSTRYNSMKGAETISVENLKRSSGKLCSSRSKATVSSSSGPAASSSSVSIRKSKEQKSQMTRSRQVTEDCSGCLELIDDGSNYEVIRSSRSVPSAASNDTEAMTSDGRESDGLVGTSQEGSDTSVSSTRIGNRPKLEKPIKKRPVSGNQGASFSSSVRHTASNIQTSKPLQRGYNNSTQRHGLRNLSCSSISDVLPSGCSDPNPLNSMTCSFTSGYPDQGSSSSSKKSRKGSTGEHSTSPQNIATPPVHVHSLSRPTLRTTSNRPASSTNVVTSARSGRVSGECRVRRAVHEDDMFLLPETIVVEQSPPTRSYLAETEVARSSSSHALLIEATPHRHSRNGTAQSSRNAHVRPSSQLSDRSRRLPVGRLADRSGYQHFNMGGVTEVLLALEQIEQDVDLSYEHLLLLDTNLLLGGLGIHDRHREMRLDIDNMTYEELLALGDQIGTVTTALSEEEQSNCLRRSIYKTGSMTPDASGDSDDDVKCCICQEEYTNGDEVGKLTICGHLYHAACIQQWFRLKNWCPICKTSALSS